MIDGRKFFDQPIKSDLKTYCNIRKIATGQGDDYTTGCLLDYPYFKRYYELIVIDLSKQQKLDADPKAIQQINFTRNLHETGGVAMFLIIEEAPKLAPALAGKATEYYINNGINGLNKKFTSSKGSVLEKLLAKKEDFLFFLYH